LEPPYCPRCADPLKGSRAHCFNCSGRVFACSLIRSAYRHQGPARAIVHCLKYRGRKRAALDEGRALDWSRFPELHGAQGLVPVPLHPGRLAERGYNQALWLARGLSESAGLPAIELLKRRRSTRPLWRLGRKERHAAVAGSFVCAGDAAGKRLLLIDDVCTTGATLEDCARTLRRAGAAEVKALTLTRQ
jgi:ComF family protein